MNPEYASDFFLSTSKLRVQLFLDNLAGQVGNKSGETFDSMLVACDFLKEKGGLSNQRGPLYVLPDYLSEYADVLAEFLPSGFLKLGALLRPEIQSRLIDTDKPVVFHGVDLELLFGQWLNCPAVWLDCTHVGTARLTPPLPL
jgi:hypothetical protein